MTIQSITANDTFTLRNLVLRPGAPIEDYRFGLDNHSSILNLGVEFNGKIISVISTLNIECENFLVISV